MHKCDILNNEKVATSFEIIFYLSFACADSLFHLNWDIQNAQYGFYLIPLIWTTNLSLSASTLWANTWLKRLFPTVCAGSRNSELEIIDLFFFSYSKLLKMSSDIKRICCLGAGYVGGPTWWVQ